MAYKIARLNVNRLLLSLGKSERQCLQNRPANIEDLEINIGMESNNVPKLPKHV